MNLLEATFNQFGGVEIQAEALPEAADHFAVALTASIESWIGERRKLVWLHVPIHKSALIPIAVSQGFTFHHSTHDTLMLTRRLIDEAFVPAYATHYIGAGGVVLNSKRELLVVVEKYRGNWGRHYKLPGGALHQGEHLVEGVVREVFEETGVQAKFDALVCLRHWHGYRYGKSDIYFVCRLSPLSEEIVMEEGELDECCWMPVEEYLDHPQSSPFNRSIVSAALNSPGLSITQMEGYADAHLREFFMPV